MATFLDISGLQHFSSFFVFLFVWLAVYAILQYTKVLGENQGINIVIGLILGLLVLFSPVASGVIEAIAPWVAVLFVFIIFINVASKMSGAESFVSGPVKGAFGIIIFLIFVVGAVSYIRDNMTLPGENETSVDYGRSASVIFHPNVIGAIFILLVAVFTIALLTTQK